MAHVEYACEGRLLFKTESTDGTLVVPRIHEVVVIDDEPYQVVDVEYWARRHGATERRNVLPTVYLVPVAPADWEMRLERRNRRPDTGKPPVRY